MNFLTTAAFEALAIALVADADTAGKPSSSPENASSLSTGLSCFSAWEYIPLLRNGVVPFSETKDFHDTQFEYRPSGDVDIHYKAPEIIWLTLTRIVIAHFISTPPTMLSSAANWRMQS
jgi:hypothetical protein